MNIVTLKSKGNAFSSWKGISIKKSMINICPSFWLYTTDFSGGDFSQWKFKLGDECTLEIAGNVVLTGYIEEITARTSLNGGSFIEIAGREKTCDLIDCPYEGGTKEWKNQSIKTLITNICNYFSIDVISSSSVSSRISKLGRASCRERV